jgi:hypothetical protein
MGLDKGVGNLRIAEATHQHFNTIEAIPIILIFLEQLGVFKCVLVQRILWLLLNVVSVKATYQVGSLGS